MAESYPAPSLSQIRTSVLPDLLISIVGPILVYRWAVQHLPATQALVLAGVLPLIRVGYSVIRYHRINLIGVFSLLTVALKIFLLVILNDTRLALVSDSFINGLYGVILLATLRMSPPLLFRIVESISPNTLAAARQQLSRRASQPGARTVLTVISAVWGVGLLLECGVQVILALSLSVQQVLLVSPIVRYATWAALLLWAISFARQRRGDQPTAAENVANGSTYDHGNSPFLHEYQGVTHANDVP